MKLLLTILLTCALTLLATSAGAQAPAFPAAGAHISDTPAAPSTPRRNGQSLRASARPATMLTAPSGPSPAAPARPQVSARHSHWLRWAIVGAAAALGVIAIVAYEHNSCGPPPCTRVPN